MKKVICFLILFNFLCSAFSQKAYFIYLQTEEAQPFYLKLDDKTHSSTASGYLILSRLRDSIYTIIVGFPKDKWPEQKFSVEMKGRDHGYLVKRFEDGNWGLFDLQTSTVQMAKQDISKSAENKAGSAGVSLFTEVLAKAANDPSLRERKAAVQPAVFKEEIVKKEETIVEDKTAVADTVPSSKNNEALAKENPEQKKDMPSPATDYKSVVTKKSESSTTEGFGLVFIDVYGNGETDTVNIIIPNKKEVKKQTSEQPKQEPKFLDIESAPQKDHASVYFNKLQPAFKGEYYTCVTPAVENELAGANC